MSEDTTRAAAASPQQQREQAIRERRKAITHGKWFTSPPAIATEQVHWSGGRTETFEIGEIRRAEDRLFLALCPADIDWLLDQLQAEREHNRKLRDPLQSERTTKALWEGSEAAGHGDSAWQVILDDNHRLREQTAKLYEDLAATKRQLTAVQEELGSSAAHVRALLDDSAAALPQQTPPPKDTSSSKGKGDDDEGGRG